jgi:CRP-like cAMP-binding protein
VDVQQRTEYLSRVPLFAGLTAPALEIVARVASEESFRRGERIFAHGEVGEKLFVISAGRVRISREIAGMGEEALAILEPGAVFGEMALLDDSPRSADAWAHESCTLLAISRESFEDLLFLHKDLAYEVLWSMVRLLTSRLRETTEKLSFLSSTGKFS